MSNADFVFNDPWFVERDSLLKYCERHGYKILEVYVTSGEEYSSNNQRAKVLTVDNEINYLWFEGSYKRVSNKIWEEKECKENKEVLVHYGPHYHHRRRGWRNITKDNRRKREYENECRQNPPIISGSNVDI